MTASQLIIIKDANINILSLASCKRVPEISLISDLFIYENSARIQGEWESEKLN